MNSEARESARILPKKLIHFVLQTADHLASVLVSLRIGPNVLSFMALMAGLMAGILFILELPLWAGIAILVCGTLDILDGKVAANANKKSLFGAMFDSSLDRYSEFFIYLGIAYHFRDHWAIWVVFFTLMGSGMVSYTRARAEGLGFECQVGIMQRAERIVILALGAILGSILKVFDPLMISVLVIIAVVSHITTAQRILHVKKVAKQKRPDKEA
jgi:CDP-diacylglycerol--glycerol-3-phosphate 3-phosphatidyltransferase